MIKLIDKYLIRAVLELFFKAKHRDILVKRIQSVLVLRLGSVGDTVLFLPTLSSMAEKYPKITFTVITWTANHEVYQQLEQKNIQLLNFKSYTKILPLIRLFIFSLKNRGRYNLIIDFEQYAYITTFFMRVMASEYSLAFKVNGFAKNRFSTASAPYFLNLHETVNFFNLAVYVFDKIELHLPEKQKCNKKVIGIHPSSKWKQKIWKKDNFISLVTRIREINPEFDFKIFLGSQDESDSWDNIKIKGLEIVKNKSITELIPIIKDLGLFISNDNGIMHLAGYLGVEVVGIFGMSDPIQWHAINNWDNAVVTPVDCAPCNKLGAMKKCRDYKCIQSIAVEDVLSKVLLLI